MRSARSLEPVELGVSLGDAKTWGLNLKDTRLPDPRKLGLPMRLVALAIAWAARTALNLPGPRRPKRRTHGSAAPQNQPKTPESCSVKKELKF